MEAVNCAEPEVAAPARVPRRDWIVLPLLSLLTIIVPAVVLETASRNIWVEMDSNACSVSTDGVIRQKPGCTTRMKTAEGPWIDYHYNECGYRGTEPCGPKPAGTARFVVVGTSIASGMHVSEEDYFTTRIRAELSKTLGKPVQFENLGSIGPGLGKEYAIDDEVLGLEPDGVFFIAVPYDLVRLDPQPASGGGGGSPPPWYKKLVPDFNGLAKTSRVMFMAQHLILNDEYSSVRALVLRASADDASKTPASELMEQRYQRMSDVVSRLASDYRRGRVPLYVIALPNRLQSVAIKRDLRSPGIDPAGFSHRMAAIAREAGAEFIDVVPALKRAQNVGDMFYTVDGHLAGSGHAIIAESVLEYFHQRQQTAAAAR